MSTRIEPYTHLAISTRYKRQFVKVRKVPRLLVLMPELGARRGGGIYQVGRSLMRLLAEKRREAQSTAAYSR